VTTTALPVPGGRLHVVDEGDLSHPPIVLVHAGIADLRAWDDMVSPLVDAGYRVVRYDTRGFGASTTDDVEFSNRADLVVVLDALGVGRAALVGNSRGGQIAFDTAIEFPGRVVAVVGVGAGLGGFEGESTPEEIALFQEMEALEEAAEPDPDAVADIDVRVWVDGPGQPETRVQAAIREKVRMMDAPQYAAGHVSGRPIPLDPPAAARLADLRCPVLAVAGELDVSDVAQAARHLEADAPDARAVIMPGVAHMIGMEVPVELAALIVEFLAPLPRWS
jgi:pimeloyl-ACP methyl ester carboxylesterase